MILPVGDLPQQVTAGVQMHCRENQILDVPVAKGLDVDKPRNLAKSVTVE